MGNPLLLFARVLVAKSTGPTLRLLFDLLARWVSKWHSWTLLLEVGAVMVSAGMTHTD